MKQLEAKAMTAKVPDEARNIPRVATCGAPTCATRFLQRLHSFRLRRRRDEWATLIASVHSHHSWLNSSKDAQHVVAPGSCVLAYWPKDWHLDSIIQNLGSLGEVLSKQLH